MKEMFDSQTQHLEEKNKQLKEQIDTIKELKLKLLETEEKSEQLKPQLEEKNIKENQLEL